jgi:hypothetical protein
MAGEAVRPFRRHLRHCLTRGEGRLTDSRAAVAAAGGTSAIIPTALLRSGPTPVQAA